MGRGAKPTLSSIGVLMFRSSPRRQRRLRRCVIVVENLPVPLDRHVWQQAIALRDAGWRVSVICPKGKGARAGREILEGIDVYRHPLPLEGSGLTGYALEYSAALACEFWLLIRIFLKQGFDVIHACNPPDLIFLAAAPFKLLGVRFIFDHHDLAPELYESRFGNRPLHKILLWLEALSFRMADHVISSNESFREIALKRGGKRPECVSVVHTIPDTSRLKRVAPDRSARAGRGVVVGYLGVIGFQDGLDHLVDAAVSLRDDYGQEDFQVVVVGDGPALASTRDQVSKLGLEAHFTFTGYLSGEALWAHLSDFDIGVIPDPRTPFNDRISMNKVFEYSALGIPIASYPLTETVRLLGDAAVYAAEGSPRALATAIGSLIADPDYRGAMARQALAVAEARFNWDRERAALLAAYDGLMPPPADPADL